MGEKPPPLPCSESPSAMLASAGSQPPLRSPLLSSQRFWSSSKDNSRHGGCSQAECRPCAPRNKFSSLSSTLSNPGSQQLLSGTGFTPTSFGSIPSSTAATRSGVLCRNAVAGLLRHRSRKKIGSTRRETWEQILFLRRIDPHNPARKKRERKGVTAFRSIVVARPRKRAFVV